MWASIRYLDAIEKLKDKISKENGNYARISEKQGQLKLDRLRILTGDGGNEELGESILAIGASIMASPTVESENTLTET